MKTETFTATFLGKLEYTIIIISDYPRILQVETNIAYKLKVRDGYPNPGAEFIVQGFQGKSNLKNYKEYTDSQGSYIKYHLGSGSRPGYLKIRR